MRFIKLSAIISTLLILFVFSQACKSDHKKAFEDWSKSNIPGKLVVSYPISGTLFPPEFQCPVFHWIDSTSRVNQWYVYIHAEDQGLLLEEVSKENKFKPSRPVWEEIKKASLNKPSTLTIIGVNHLEPSVALSGFSIDFKTSKDSVNAPIMYRDVILPVREAREHLDSIKWRLCNISSDEMSHVALQELPVCGNCHSFAMDGSSFGMDVDASMDKGAYTIMDMDSDLVINNNKIITWTKISKDPCLGLLSKVSPDGRYVITTIDDNSFLINREDPMYSQFFFPIRGELAVYDRKLDSMYRLPGASDTTWCQSNPNWSPDGKYIVFTRAPAIPASESGITDGFKRDQKVNKDFTDKFVNGERGYKYDLYRIPFNEGKGGVAEPIRGASDNGKSNYFARYSPDGKWIVFCQANNFMLLMGDSRLYIIPAEGGEPRLMNCNVENMNSYHSWSPNSRWLITATKERGPYTQMYLTHIDENGQDSPPVFIETATPPGRAVNIPEFVNIPIDRIINIIDDFTEAGDYLTISEAKYRATVGDHDKALTAANKAIKLEPDNMEYYKIRAFIMGQMGNWKEALEDYNKVLTNIPDDNQALHNRGIAKKNLKDYKGAIDDFSKCIELQDNDTIEYFNRGLIYAQQKNYDAALRDFIKVLQLNPKDTNSYFNRGLVYTYMNDHQFALKDFQVAAKLKPNEERFHYYSGLANISLKKYGDAEANFAKALQINSNSVEAYVGRARARKILGKRDAAFEDIDKALSINPNYSEAYQGRGELKMFKKDFQGAISDYGKAILLDPSSLNYAKRGDAYMEMKDYMQAILDYDKAIDMDAKLASAWYMRGKAKLMAGHKDEACTDLNKAFKLGYVKAVSLIQKNCLKES